MAAVLHRRGEEGDGGGSEVVVGVLCGLLTVLILLLMATAVFCTSHWGEGVRREVQALLYREEGEEQEKEVLTVTVSQPSIPPPPPPPPPALPLPGPLQHCPPAPAVHPSLDGGDPQQQALLQAEGGHAEHGGPQPAGNQ